MKRFVCLKTNIDNHDYIIEVFKNFLGNYLNYKIIEEYIFIYNEDFSISELTDVIQALEIDLDSGIKVYLSSKDHENNLSNEWTLVKKIFDVSGNGVYQLKELIEINRYIENSMDLLKFILDGTGVDRNILEAMALCDLNVSKASNVLYMHRNTLIYKIDKLYEKTGFDIKTFKDLYNLYKLIGA